VRNSFRGCGDDTYDTTSFMVLLFIFDNLLKWDQLRLGRCTKIIVRDFELASEKGGLEKVRVRDNTIEYQGQHSRTSQRAQEKIQNGTCP
jgi:hypothetical protein